jgi:hypothetical protein
VEGIPWFTPVTRDPVLEKRKADLLWAYENYFLAEIERVMAGEPSLTTSQATEKIAKQWDELDEDEKLEFLSKADSKEEDDDDEDDDEEHKEEQDPTLQQKEAAADETLHSMQKNIAR